MRSPAPQRPQDRDISLFSDYHDQRGDDVERRDEHDHQQYHERHRLGQFDGLEEIRVVARPVTDEKTSPGRNAKVADHLRREERVVQFEVVCH
ncbi:MAG: hypothetical protein R3E65_12795 [Steroidobacteraceae bacterium]